MPARAPVIISPVDQANARLHQTEQTYSRTQRELQNLITIRATTPMSVVEVDQKDREIAELRSQLGRMEKEKETLLQTVARMQATIKNQSEAISHPKQYYPAGNTPARAGKNQPAGIHGPRPSQQILPPPPPPFFTPGVRHQPLQQFPSVHDRRANQWTPRGHQGQMQPPMPVPQLRHTNVNQFGSPEPLGQFHTNIGQQMAATGRQQPAPVSNDNSLALVRLNDEGALAPVMAQFARVWGMAETFSATHVNTPSTAKDQGLSEEIKGRILAAAAPNPAFPFMSTPLTRYWLVTKMILQWIVNNVLKHDTFAGLDKDLDRVIEANRSQIYQSTPVQVKVRLLGTIASQMASLNQRPDFESFVSTLARTRGNELWAIVKPMMHAKTSRDWDDLHTLVVEAHHLAKLMYSGQDQFRYEMPSVNQPFRKEAMLPKDPYPNIHTLEQLEARGTTVRLAITPHVIARTHTAEGHVDEATVLPAFVFINATQR